MSDKKLRVLMAAHIGEPIGGLSLSYETLLASSYSKQLDVQFVETSKGNLPFDERGKWGVRNWVNALENIYRFYVALFRRKPNLVDIASVQGASFIKHSLMVLGARLAGVVVVFQPHCGIDRMIPPDNNLWRRYILFVLSRVQGIVTLSREWDTLSGLLPDVSICHIPNAINVEPYILLPRPKSNQQETVNLLFLGHIGQEKGCFELISVIERLREKTNVQFCLHLVGETLRDGEKELIRSDIDIRNLHAWIQIHKPEYGDKKISRLSMSDIFVLPSHHEGMPMSIIEAMAAGLPVVATRVGGIPDQVIHEKTGLLVDLGDVQALADALLLLINNSEQRTKMGQSGRKRASQYFDIETKADNLISFYYQLLDLK